MISRALIATKTTDGGPPPVGGVPVIRDFQFSTANTDADLTFAVPSQANDTVAIVYLNRNAAGRPNNHAGMGATWREAYWSAFGNFSVGLYIGLGCGAGQDTVTWNRGTPGFQERSYGFLLSPSDLAAVDAHTATDSFPTAAPAPGITYAGDVKALAGFVGPDQAFMNFVDPGWTEYGASQGYPGMYTLNFLGSKEFPLPGPSNERGVTDYGSSILFTGILGMMESV